MIAIDAGNTNIVFAVHDGTDWRGRWRVPKTTSHRPVVTPKFLLACRWCAS